MDKYFAFACCAIMLVLGLSPIALNQAWAAAMEGKIMIKGKMPEGIMIKKNKVMLKKGYTFERVSKNQVNVVARMPGGRGITGSFDCTCNGADGGCDAIVTPTSVSCAASTCKSSCYMIVTIPGTTSVLH